MCGFVLVGVLAPIHASEQASMGASPSGVSGAAAATSTSEDHEAIPLHRRVSLAMDGRQNDAENQEDECVEIFKYIFFTVFLFSFPFFLPHLISSFSSNKNVFFLFFFASAFLPMSSVKFQF